MSRPTRSETAVSSVVVRGVLGAGSGTHLRTVLVVIVVVAIVDQVMSVLVLNVIRLHNGPMSRAETLEVLVPALGLSVVASCFAFIVVLLLERGGTGAGLVLVFIVVQGVAYRSHAATRRRHQALTLVHNFVAGSVGTESLDSLAQRLLPRIRTLLRAASVELMIMDESVTGEGGHGRPPAASGSALILAIREDDVLKVSRREIDTSDWLTARVLAEEESTLVSRATKQSALRRWLAKRGLRDAIVVALPASSG